MNILSHQPPIRLPLVIERQPDDRSCGPTCLHSVYRHFGDDRSLDELIAAFDQLDTGGTLAVQLGCDALRSGYAATIISYNLLLFDPTWLSDPVTDLPDRLRAQAAHKPGDHRMVVATRTYLDFLELGGTVVHEVLSASLIHRILAADLPILTGLSATYLWNAPREIPETDTPDDVRGLPVGHFVVLCGDNPERRTVTVADPWRTAASAPLIREQSLDRVIAAILLGVLTYDANLLIISPRDRAWSSRS